MGTMRKLMAVSAAGVLAIAACGEGHDPARDGAPARVDRARPVFSHPTRITHPLFPVTEARQVVQLGHEGAAALRIEVTRLPERKTIHWNGRDIEAVVSQFVGYSDGRILEVARDYFAQADDGSVWYLGEDVDNFEHGVVIDHEGSWLAGQDGPPGMIMPAHPRVGDVYRSENIPGLVLETDTVRAVDRTVPGPRGPVHGAIVVQEVLMDGSRETKTFAPGYGEFTARAPGSDELVQVVVAAPIDAKGVPRSPQLDRIVHAATEALSGASDVAAARTAAIRAQQAWEATPRGAGTPALLRRHMEDSLAALRRAAAAGDASRTAAAAFTVGSAALDLQLRDRPIREVDRSRLALLVARLERDRAARSAGAVAGDLAAMATIRARSTR
jgi:hypothetical protein